MITTWHVWYTDEHVVTLLAEHTILLPGRHPHINFRVSVLHLKKIHTAFSLYHGGIVSWRVQAQEPFGQSKGSVKVS